MTAEKKSGLLPRIVGGAKQKAEGMVTRTLESAPATAVAAKTRELVHNIVAGVLTTALVFSLSIFLYATFYHAYMPIEVHEEHVNLQFLPCDTKPALCSFPNATLPLKRSLMSGQAYSIALLLEVPDSPINQGLGMFLSCLSVIGADGEAARSCRSSILEYRSELLRAIDTLVLAPFHLMGLLTQRQWVRVPFFLDFQDNPSSPATELQLELQSKFIQIYSAKMEIHAQLSGLRHIMYHHPWISSLTGILANISTLTLILLISWAKLTTSTTSTTSSAPQKHVTRPERQVSESSEEEVTILDKPDGKEDTIETVSSWK